MLFTKDSSYWENVVSHDCTELGQGNTLPVQAIYFGKYILACLHFKL